jgi:hypothetical protein
MQRKARTQKVARFSEQRTPKEADPICRRAAGWVESQRKNIGDAYENMPDLDFLPDRDAELWAPLLAVCAAAAPERVAELKKCALTLTGTKITSDIEDSFPLKLLADVRKVWPDGAAYVLTATLLEQLKAIPESPWNEKDHELNPRRLAKMLRPFGADPREVVPGKGHRGYLREEFRKAFSRYLPESDSQSATTATTRMNTGENAISASATAAQCSGYERASNPHEHWSVADVADKHGAYGRGGEGGD